MKIAVPLTWADLRMTQRAITQESWESFNNKEIRQLNTCVLILIAAF